MLGIIRGNPDNQRPRIRARDLLDPDLVDLTARIPTADRYSFVFKRRKQQLDYMLVNQAFAAALISIGFSRIDRQFSDHAGLLARFEW